MSAQTDLIAAKANIATIIKNITANPKPTYTENGRTISWNEYLSSLIQQSEAFDKMLQRSAGPFEVVSQGLS